jgi:hypothetical protein
LVKPGCTKQLIRWSQISDLEKAEVVETCSVHCVIKCVNLNVCIDFFGFWGFLHSARGEFSNYVSGTTVGSETSSENLPRTP